MESFSGNSSIYYSFLVSLQIIGRNADDNANKLFFFCTFKHQASVAWALGAGYF